MQKEQLIKAQYEALSNLKSLSVCQDKYGQVPRVKLPYGPTHCNGPGTFFSSKFFCWVGAALTFKINAANVILYTIKIICLQRILVHAERRS